MKTYRLYTYDVWGNANDGYEVNNVYCESQTYNIDPNWNDKQLINELKKLGLIKKGLHQKIEVGGNDLTITFDYKGRPEFELRLENN